ncbi:hypothetical protein ACH5RR_007546 [Cinchona calisaya]|uniref:Thioredoxin domain-containing protein n=1 Tax=Cinchona calisaya TaxID=153742 RepID=A0ABD3AS56_9GENT
MVGASMRLRLVMVLLCEVCWLCCCSSCVASSLSWSSAPPICPSPQSKIPPFLITTLFSQCHHPNSNSPLQMNGNSLERALSSKSGNMYTAVLFYASWCPFSRNARSTFEVLASMYTQIDHLAVEQYSAMPSLFSRYGIHSLPAVVLVNQTSRTRHYGPKHLDSLMKFYKKTTGHEPVEYIVVDQSGSLGSGGKSVSFAKEILTKERYLLFSMLFLCMRVLVYLFPRVLFHSRTLWMSIRCHLNLELFGETSQNLGRILHMIDVQRVWTKVRLCKSRNFHCGARNARVLASSLASVSLGETSTSRL